MADGGARDDIHQPFRRGRIVLCEHVAVYVTLVDKVMECNCFLSTCRRHAQSQYVAVIDSHGRLIHKSEGGVFACALESNARAIPAINDP
jgi:hypothetical protein